MNIEELRKEIDFLDDKIIPLLNQRMTASKKISKVKAENNLPVFDKKREAEIKQKIKLLSNDYSAEILNVYETIFKTSKEIQKEQV